MIILFALTVLSFNENQFAHANFIVHPYGALVIVPTDFNGEMILKDVIMLHC